MEYEAQPGDKGPKATKVRTDLKRAPSALPIWEGRVRLS